MERSLECQGDFITTSMNANRLANDSCIFTQNGYYARESVLRTHGGMVGEGMITRK